MKKNYTLLVAFVTLFALSQQLHSQNTAYWREGFPRAGGSTFPTSTGTVASMPPAYYKSGSGLGWYSYGGYNANSSNNCAVNNTADHIRLLGAAVDSAFLVTPTVDFGINEFHFLRTRTSRRFTLYKTTDTVASTTNWVKVAFTVSSAFDICTDTTIIVNDLTARRLKLVIQQGQDTDIDSIWLTSVSAILPIRFGSINGFQNGGANQISWNIESEVNTVRYEIEKSADGATFTVAGSVTANNAGKYSWIDNSTSLENTYYRVKGIDRDGAFLYSSIVKINGSKKNQELSILPNPVKNGLLNVQLNNFEKGIFTYTLFNSTGQQFVAGKINNEFGSTSKTIQLPVGISPGVYKLLLVNGATKVSKTVVVE